jgi:hypothetical protein
LKLFGLSNVGRDVLNRPLLMAGGGPAGVEEGFLDWPGGGPAGVVDGAWS